MHLYFHVQFPPLVSEFNENWTYLTDSWQKNFSTIKFHENSSSESRVVPRGRTDVTMLIIVFTILRKRLVRMQQKIFYLAQNAINSEFIFSLFSVSFEKYVIIVRPSRYKTFAVSRSVLSFCSPVFLELWIQCPRAALLLPDTAEFTS